MRISTIASFAAVIILTACAATSTDGPSSESADSTGFAGDASTDGGSATDAAGSADAAVADAGPAVPTYAEEAPVIAAHCGSCHGSKFGTLAQVKTSRAKMVQELEAQKMPKDDRSWSTTADGAALVEFLTSSTELN